jgi:hypothetical protein
MINGQAVANVQHTQLGGAISSGEFGTIFSEIFAPETETEFDWDHWATLRGRRMYVFSYRVEQHLYGILDGESHRSVKVGYHGLIYADRDNYTVMRWTLICDNIPADFAVRDVKLDVNYDFIKIADRDYVLPLKTEIRSSRGRYLSLNEAEFHLYRKFGTETSITFDTTPDPIPEEKTKEEPVKP